MLWVTIRVRTSEFMVIYVQNFIPNLPWPFQWSKTSWESCTSKTVHNPLWSLQPARVELSGQWSMVLGLAWEETHAQRKMFWWWWFTFLCENLKKPYSRPRSGKVGMLWFIQTPPDSSAISTPFPVDPGTRSVPNRSSYRAYAKYSGYGDYDNIINSESKDKQTENQL